VRTAENWAEVGARVREARTVANLTQVALAQEIGMDRSALAKVEAGERRLDAVELFRLSDALRLPLAHFVAASPLSAVSRRAVVEDSVGDSEKAAWLLDADLAQHARDAQWLVEAGLLPIPPSWVREAGTVADAQRVARELRGHLRMRPSDPAGPMAAVCEQAGLYILAVDRGGGGASLTAGAYGVAVIGAASDPGRRRFTAAHELGHHVLGDAYSSDLTFTGRDERERIVDAFASEFLLPAGHVKTVLDGISPAEQRATLIALSAEFRVSWSLTVRTAAKQGEVQESQLRAAMPLAADFLMLAAGEPTPDLDVGTTGPVWRRAVLAAVAQSKITPERAVELLHGALTVTEVRETADLSRD
jgi:Zn-dependent peptidase ImmA (M78 family)/transcriptional regulator with XRE-family HTH domain